ncbi:MAG: protein kinase, partial [Nitrososphaerales archaeon]
AYLDKGLYSEAVKKYYQILDLRFENRHLVTNLSQAFIGLKKVDQEALRIYQKAVRYSTDNKEIYDTLASVFLKEGREDQAAIKIYKLALLHESSASERLYSHLIASYFKQKAFLQCKELAETFFSKGAADSRSLVFYLRSCWNIGQYNDAINYLKKLFDASDQDQILLKYLCITYLEKIDHSEAKNKSVQLSFIDRELVSEFLTTRENLESLQDVSLYLEVKKCLIEKKHWRYLEPAWLAEREKAVLYGEGSETDFRSPQPATEASQLDFDLNTEVLERLLPLEPSENGKPGGQRPLTFEDFEKDGSAIFSDESIGSAFSKVPDRANVLITLELSKFNTICKRYGVDHARKIKDKLAAMLCALLAKHTRTYTWSTANALLIFTEETVPAVTLSIELLNKLNRYNFVSEPADRISVTISIHKGKDGASADSHQSVSDISTGIKLGMAGDVHLSSKDRAIYGKAFRKQDRIFVTDEAYQQIRQNNRFKTRPLGSVRFKYMSGALSLHEVIWRNPIDDLKFGFIKKLGRFDLLSELSNKGAMRVFKGKDAGLQRFVILKVIQSEAFNSLPPNNQRKIEFYNRAKAQAQMNHPNITNIYEVDEEQGLTYVAREYVEGVPINQVFREGDPVDADRLVKLMFQACKSLQYSHRSGFVHANLKPNNVLLTKQDELKISDFVIPHGLFVDQNNLESE